MGKIQLVVFDMAGTTIDEDNVVYKCLHKVVVSVLPTVTLEEVLLHGAGKEKRNAIVDICAVNDLQLMTEDIDALFSNFKILLANAYDEYPLKLYADALEVFAWLHSKGIKVAFNTGYDRKTAEFILHKVNIRLGADIDLLMTASDVPRNRPFPDMIEKCCELLGINVSNTIKVGDSAIDIEEGKTANTFISIGITTGAQTKEQLAAAQPNFIIDSLTELKEIVAYHNSTQS